MANGGDQGYIGPINNPTPLDAILERSGDSAGWVKATGGRVRRGRTSGLAASVVTGPDRYRLPKGTAVVVHSLLGSYRYALPGDFTTAAITRPGAGTSRLDFLIVKLYDADSGSTALSEPKIEVRQGAAAAIPSAPDMSADDGWLLMAAYTVPAVGDITFVRGPQTVAVGGIVPVTGETDRNGLALDTPPLYVHRLDTGLIEVNKSGATDGWTPLAAPRVAATVRRSAAQSIANNSTPAVDIVWDSEIEDTASLWAAGATLTIPVTGLYTVTASVALDAAPTAGLINASLVGSVSSETALIRANAATAAAFGPRFETGTRNVWLTKDETVRLRVFQNTGAAVSTWSTAGADKRFPTELSLELRR